MFNASSSFMSGKFIRLKVISALDDPCLCCLCRMEMDRENGHSVSIALEKKLFRNGLVNQLGDGMGISFIRDGNVDIWQMMCLDCSYINENEEVDVVSDVYTLRFHKNYGNIEINSDNIYDAFSFAPVLGLDVCRDIRNEFDALERMALIEKRYLKANEKREFHFTQEFQRFNNMTYNMSHILLKLIQDFRSFTGLDLTELHEIYEKYLRKYERYFRTFTALEWFNALLIYLRTGVSVQLISGMMYSMTDRTVSVQRVGKNIRKIMWLLGR